MRSGSPRQTQDGQDLLLHLLLLSAAEALEAGVDHGLGLVAPQGEEEQEEQGQQQQGPGVEEGQLRCSGGGGPLLEKQESAAAGAVGRHGSPPVHWLLRYGAPPGAPGPRVSSAWSGLSPDSLRASPQSVHSVDLRLMCRGNVCLQLFIFPPSLI